MKNSVEHRENAFFYAKNIGLMGFCTLPFVDVPDQEIKIWLLPMLMVFIGPGFVLLDWFSRSSQNKWMHHAESAVRAMCMAWVVSQMPHGLASVTSLAVIFLLYYLLCIAGMQCQPYATTRMKMSDDNLVTCAVMIAFGACVLEVTLKKWVGLGGLGLLLLLGAMQILLWKWRHSMWYGLHLKMSPAHHAAVWPAVFERTTPRTFWGHVDKYIEKYPSDTAVCLRALPMDALLILFHLTNQRDRGPSYVHLREHAKLAINEKEPRAEFVWPLYADHDAAVYIEALMKQEASASLETMELPAL